MWKKSFCAFCAFRGRLIPHPLTPPLKGRGALAKSSVSLDVEKIFLCFLCFPCEIDTPPPNPSKASPKSSPKGNRQVDGQRESQGLLPFLEWFFCAFCAFCAFRVRLIPHPLTPPLKGRGARAKSFVSLNVRTPRGGLLSFAFLIVIKKR